MINVERPLADVAVLRHADVELDAVAGDVGEHRQPEADRQPGKHLQRHRRLGDQPVHVVVEQHEVGLGRGNELHPGDELVGDVQRRPECAVHAGDVEGEGDAEVEPMDVERAGGPAVEAEPHVAVAPAEGDLGAGAEGNAGRVAVSAGRAPRHRGDRAGQPGGARAEAEGVERIGGRAAATYNEEGQGGPHRGISTVSPPE